MSAGMSWVIERYHNSALVYWSGVDGRRVSEWASQFDKAIKFADQDSAARMLAHACDGIGRTAAHSYCIGADGVLTKSAAA